MDAEDLGRLIRHASSEGIPLIPRGAGTGMPGGNLGPGVVVSLQEGFDRVHPADPDRGRIRAGAGAVAADVERIAREAGFTLPFLPSSAAWCTVGGMAANNAAGARSFGHGASAEWITALEVVDARGTEFTLSSEARRPDAFDAFDDLLGADVRAALPPFPDVRKNASGYALDRYTIGGDPAQLLIGSEGTLGVITAVEFRMLRAPVHRGIHLRAVRDPAEATRVAVRAADSSAVACEFLGRRFLEMSGLDRDPEFGPISRQAYALFLIEFEGSTDRVRQELEDAERFGDAGAGRSPSGTLSAIEPEHCERLWALRRRASPMIAREAERGRISTQFIEDSVVPPYHLGDYLTGLDRILADAGFDAVVFGHAGDGNVHVNPLVDVESADWRERVRSALHATADLVTGLGGTLSGEHGDGRLRAPLLEGIWGPEWVEAFRLVKDHFDPDGVLNPGVILPLPGQDPLEGLAPRPRSWPS